MNVAQDNVGRERKVTKMMLVVIGAYLVCFTPQILILTFSNIFFTPPYSLPVVIAERVSLKHTYLSPFPDREFSTLNWMTTSLI